MHAQLGCIITIITSHAVHRGIGTCQDIVMVTGSHVQQRPNDQTKKEVARHDQMARSTHGEAGNASRSTGQDSNTKKITGL